MNEEKEQINLEVVGGKEEKKDPTRNEVFQSANEHGEFVDEETGEIVAVTKQEIKISAEIRKEFSYVEYHADGLCRAGKNVGYTPFSLIQKITVENTTNDYVPGLFISFSFNNDAFSIDDIVLPPFPPCNSDIINPYIKVKKPLIDQLQESVTCELTINLNRLENDVTTVLSTAKYMFNILPISQPTEDIYLDRRIFAKYVTPLSPGVKQLANKAVLFNEGKPIVAYQNGDDIKSVLNELKAVYTVLHDANILYQNPPAKDAFAQRVRMPEEVLRDKKATCFDSSILYCSLLDELGFNSLLVMIDGHAFVGVFLKDDYEISGGMSEKASELTNQLADGNQTLVLIESTFITSGHTESFQEAMDMAKSHLRMYEGVTFYAIDISWCHSSRIYTPIPTEGNDFELDNYIKQKEIEDKDLNPIINKDFQNVEGDFEMDRFKAWERKLLDLTERNRLVSFRTDSGSCTRLLAKDIISTLSSNDSVSLELVNAPHLQIAQYFMQSDMKAFEQIIGDIDDNTIIAFGLENTLKNLIRKAKSALDETGASPLYLSLGMLTFQSPKSHRRIHAPFLLLPISIKRESGGRRFTMSYDTGDLKINETFFQYYKIFNPDINFNSILDFDDISKYQDLVRTFKDICGGDIILDEQFFFISNLSFAHQVMWLDMVKRKNELSKNTIIKSIVDNQSHLTDKVISDDEPIEELEKYEDFAAPLYYDSSQLKAILDCGAGKSFILDGPPGTGKSQTIVNMITNAFYNGKRVLFVAEKKAALDVVADRLEKLGLGKYCLELHSNKATKADFFTKLGDVMDFGPTKSPEEYHDKCIELTDKKNSLRKTINKMHNPKQYLMSLYDCIVATKQYGYLEDNKVTFSNEFITSLTKEKYETIEKMIDTYITFAKAVHNFDSTILKAFGIKKINFLTDRDVVRNELVDASKAIEAYLKSVRTFVTSLPFEVNLSDDTVDSIYKIYDFAFNHDLYMSSVMDILNNKINLEPSFNSIRALIDIKKEYEKKYRIDELVSNVNLDELANTLRTNTSFFKKIKAQKHCMEVLQPYVKWTIKKTDIGLIIIECNEYIEKKQQLVSKCEEFVKLTGLDPLNAIDKIDSVKETFKATKSFIELVKEFAHKTNSQESMVYFFNLANKKDTMAKFAFDMIYDSYKKYDQVDKLLTEKYEINKDILKAKGDYFVELKKLLETAADPEYFKDLFELTNVNKLNNGFKLQGVDNLLNKVLLSKCRYTELHELFKLSLAYGYLGLYFQDEDINSFSPVYIGDQIKSYKDAIKEYSETTVQCVAAKISESFARTDINYSASGAIGRLKKSIANNGRGVTIRGTLSEFGDVILRYFPCFLMSPLSAAQYLSVDSERGKSFSKFDIVIFDEASQIPTHEAIGPIARGNSLIIAGDPKQMPPSPYFSAGLSLGDEEEESDITKFTDSPSLLDECISIDMPRHRLSYHYRSKHESLIQFSNDNFYNSGLYTFPSSSTSSSCISFEYVKTKEPKKDSSLSDEELNKIIKTFKKVYEDEETCKKSIGIISFNIKQADKIIDSINELLANNNKLAERVDEATKLTKEPWFVKSIENVQGDERDIIVLSVGFALNKSGYPAVRGPLVAGDNNGERRLNVAASRSKEKMIVISTIRASQFQDDSLIKNPGARCLKHFLKYAEDASVNLKNEHRIDNSNILYFLKNDLEERGFEVDTNVGNSAFRVNLAIRSKNSDHYELGVLIDTDSIDNNISCRDKFYVQESVLNAMKWKTITIYTLEYFKYPEETIDKILKAYDSEYVKEEVNLDVKIEKAEESQLGEIYDVAEYKEPIYACLPYSNDYGYDDHRIYGLIKDIIDTMSPVSYNEIKNIVGKACYFKAFNEIREKRLKDQLNCHFFRKSIYDQSQYFYWKDQNRNVDKFRKANGRSVYDISKEEIATAMKQIYDMQGGISEEDLFKELMNAFDFPTRAVTRYYRDRFIVAYEYALDKKIIG